MTGRKGYDRGSTGSSKPIYDRGGIGGDKGAPFQNPNSDLNPKGTLNLGRTKKIQVGTRDPPSPNEPEVIVTIGKSKEKTRDGRPTSIEDR